MPAGNQGEAQPWGTLRGTLETGLFVNIPPPGEAGPSQEGLVGQRAELRGGGEMARLAVKKRWGPNTRMACIY